ncbi:MAG: hypothetical protein IT262_10540 [Saprospiraceae bacterium]|nr:hypothetical protein [Saprospiraceae bacterium]
MKIAAGFSNEKLGTIEIPLLVALTVPEKWLITFTLSVVCAKEAYMRWTSKKGNTAHRMHFFIEGRAAKKTPLLVSRLRYRCFILQRAGDFALFLNTFQSETYDFQTIVQMCCTQIWQTTYKFDFQPLLCVYLSSTHSGKFHQRM